MTRMYLRVSNSKLPVVTSPINRMYFNDDTAVEFNCEQNCSTCAHWDREDQDATLPRLKPCRWLGLETFADFGCTQWEQERG